MYQLIRQSNGRPVEIDDRFEIGAGGEAHIYALPDEVSLVAKVYHRPTEMRARKLAVMLAAPPVDPTAAQGHASIAWPVDLLCSQSDTGRIVGYLMPRAIGTRPVIDFYNPAARRADCPLFNYQYLIRTARNLAAVLSALHARNYVIGDVNESNILVTPTALVTVVDTDSFQVRDPQRESVFRCPVGKPEFTPAELQGKMLHYIDRTPEHDRFGLAVLIFLLLMEGTHPFAGVYLGEGDPPPYEARIAAGHFPYGTRAVPYRPLPLAPPISILPMQLWQLFTRCFQEGHDDPRARPDAQTWAQALRDAENNLLTCSVNAQHRYGKHLQECPWCERRVLLGGRDPFPSQQSVESQQHLHPGIPVQTPLPPAIIPTRETEQVPGARAEGEEGRKGEGEKNEGTGNREQAIQNPKSKIQNQLHPTPYTLHPTLAPPPRRVAHPDVRRNAVTAIAAAVVLIATLVIVGRIAAHQSPPPPLPLPTVSAQSNPSVQSTIDNRQSTIERPAPTLEMLQKAVSNGDEASVKDLLARAPQLAKQASKAGWTPLHYAAYSGRFGIAQMLIDSGADVNATNNDGFTPLHLAAQEGHADTVKLLIDHGANVNAKEKLGWTPLHFAAQEGYPNVVKQLIAGGADVNSKESKGLTPLAVAIRENKRAVADLLRQNGGK